MSDKQQFLEENINVLDLLSPNCNHNQYELVKYIVDNRKHLDYYDDILCWAIVNKHADIVDIILDNKLYVNFSKSYYWCAVYSDNNVAMEKLRNFQP